MAKRNEIVGPFRGHDTSDAGHSENVAFGCFALFDKAERPGGDYDISFGNSDARRGRLFGHIDHHCFALGVDVRQLAHAGAVCSCWPAIGVRSARVALSTSGWRIRLSPTRKALAPACDSRAISAGVKIPLSATMMQSAGISCPSCSVVSRWVPKLFRSRLFIPPTWASSASARMSSSSL